MRRRPRWLRRPLTAPTVIDALFRGLLHRPAGTEGIEHYERELARGVPLEDVVHSIGHSHEYFEGWLRGEDLPTMLSTAWAGSRRRRGEPPIYFNHIMKTGGTSLVDGLTSLAGGRFCLTAIFIDHLVGLPRPLFDMASLVAGHLGPMPLELMPPDTVTATLIRDPVDRVLSHYTHVLVDPALPSSETAGLSLEAFVHSPRWRPFVENFQARSLLHRIDLDALWVERSPEDLLSELDVNVRPAIAHLPVQSFFMLAPYAPSGPELRTAALTALDRIDHVGVTDSLDLLFRELARRWGVDDPPPPPRANVNAQRPAREQVATGLRDEILEANTVDVALYETARARAAAVARSGS
jgi:hypothetical protein